MANPAASPQLDRQRLQVHRVTEGVKTIALTISEEIRGLRTHRVGNNKKVSEYCAGDRDCPAVWHKLPSMWKGYIVAGIWQQEGNLWKPAVLEITEGLEVDMRHIYQAGQQWELFRPAPQGKKQFPVSGVLLSEGHPVPPAKQFDPIAVLRTMYHAPRLVLDQDNDMPDRQIVELFAGPMPLFTIPKEKPAAPTPEQRAKIKELLSKGRIAAMPEEGK